MTLSSICHSIQLNKKIKKTFLSQHYQKHNIARLSHLESLGLDLNNKTVFEFGAGIGDHTYYYLIKNCKVTASDARADLVNYVKNRFGVDCIQIDIEKDIEKIKDFPRYDIIHCYGVLYHVNNPAEFINAIKGKCSLLLLETCVSGDDNSDDIHLIEENRSSPTQALSGRGCRPTRKWIFEQLKKNFPFVYVPITQPDHPEFPKNWNKSSNNGALIRAVFIGSEATINSDKIVDYLPKVYT